MSSLDEILKEIKKANSIVLLTHENPDGDAIGSSLAFYQALKAMDKDVQLIVPKYPRCFSFLPGIDEVKTEGSREKYDLAIALDCASIKLLNGWTQYFEDSDSTIVIDHHSSNTRFGDLNYVEMNTTACAQVVYEMFIYYGWEINNDIGTALITGIVTDTGGFQYDGVSSTTFDIASDLLSQGVNIAKVYKNVLATHTKTSFELKKRAIDRMEFLEDGKVTFTYINREDEEAVHSETCDYEGIVNEGINIEGVEVSIFLHEIEDGMKASLRANSYVNVSDVCMMFGGGGHIRAAGATIHGTPAEIKAKLLNETRRQLK